MAICDQAQPKDRPAAGGRTDLSRRDVILLAVASAIVTANAYYIHPIVRPVAETFGVSDGFVGIVPAANQIALALGVLLLLPLGDRISNRALALICISAQIVCLVVLAVAENFALFAASSAVLGFFTVTPYLLPAYASKRVPPERLGFVTAVLTTGVVAGVVASRVGAGVIAEAFGWRAVYWVAAALMVASSIVLPLLMQSEPRRADAPPLRYRRLLSSLAALAFARPRIMASGVIQGLSFAIFLVVWMGIGLHLTSPEIGLGTDIVGYLAVFTIFNLLTTPRLGRWADRVGAEKARFSMTVLQLGGVALFAFAGADWRLLILPIILSSVAGPAIDVAGRMTSLREPPQQRSRLLSLYITLMFLGGGFGSWSGAIAYDLGGWAGTVTLALALSLLAMGLSARERMLTRR